MIGWGIIGAGDVTERKAPPAIFAAEDSTVVHVMRRDGDRARSFAERHGIPKATSDADSLLNDPEVTAVYVATPTASHADYAIRAAQAGKHVLVEKPLAMSAEQGEAMIEAADRADVRLWVAYYRRTLPRFAAIRTVLGCGRLGRLLGVTMTHASPTDFDGWRWDPEQNTGGAFYETSCHTIDALDHLLGPASDGAGVVTDDLHGVALTCRFGDVPASGTFMFGTPHRVDRTVITGELGTLSFASFSPDPIVITTGEGVVELPIGDPPHVHGPLVKTIIDELRGYDPSPADGRSALRTARVMDAALAGARR